MICPAASLLLDPHWTYTLSLTTSFLHSALSSPTPTITTTTAVPLLNSPTTHTHTLNLFISLMVSFVAHCMFFVQHLNILLGVLYLLIFFWLYLTHLKS